MICKNCGAEIGDNVKFCPSCGHNLASDQASRSSESSMPSWFKWLLAVIALLCAIGLYFIMGSDALTSPVEDQLKAIRENRVSEAYYNYTSKDFQESTPLEKFKEFVKVFPALSENKSVRFIDRKSDDSVGSLDAILTTKDGQEVKAEYRLVQDKSSNKWKIESVKFEDVVGSQKALKPLASEDEKMTKEVVEKQMEAISKKDFKHAYQEHTSKAFKDTTSQKQFEGFVNTQPGFFNYKSITWDRAVTDGETAVLTGNIVMSDDQIIPVAYQLVKEEGNWKILQIQLGSEEHPANGEKSNLAKKLEFSQFVLGSSVDEEGIVSKNQVTFPSSTKELYLNLYIANGVTDAKINVDLEHSDTKTKIPPVETVLKEDGHAILRVVFSPPPEGWPVGNYLITAASSTGAKKTYEFKIE